MHEVMEYGTHIKLTCDALIDQGRYIDGDPVGKRCSNVAIDEHPSGALLCWICRDILQNSPKRVSFKRPWGKNYQVDMIARAVANLQTHGAH